MKQTKIILTGGGSGGHITPLVALAKQLRSDIPDAYIIYYGAFGEALGPELMGDVVDKVKTLPSGKLRRYGGFKGLQRLKLWKAYLFNVRDIIYITAGMLIGLIRVGLDRPDIVFSKGGYPALPVCLAAGLTGRPLVTHDSDSVLGLTHRIAGRFIMLSLLGSPKPTYAANQRYVGVPVNLLFATQQTSSMRSKFMSELGFKSSHKLILATGGGNGALALSLACIDAFAAVAQDDKSRVMVLLAGKHIKEVTNYATNLDHDVQSRLKIIDFSNQMLDLVRAAEVVITRAGATSLAEIAAAAKPCIILPNAQLAGAHQVHNSQIYIETKSALVCMSQSAAVDVDCLIESLTRVLNEPGLAESLSINIAELAQIGATKEISKIIAKQVSL